MGASSKSTPLSPGSSSIGTVSEPQMMNCPARKPPPTAAATSATWRTMLTTSPMLASRSAGTGMSRPLWMTRPLSPSRRAPLAHRVALPEDHVSLENAAGQHRLHVVHRPIDIGKLDGGAERGDGAANLFAAGAGRQVAPDIGRDLRLGSGLLPAGERNRRARREFSAVEQKADDRRGQPALGLHGRRAKTDLPADLLGAVIELSLPQLHLRAHAVGDARVGECLAHDCDPPADFRSRTPRSNPRPSSPRPARRPRSMCC